MGKKTNASMAVRHNIAICATFILASLYFQPLSAQCTLACQDHVYLALDTACEYEVTIADVVRDTTDCTGAFVEVHDEYGNNLGNRLDGRYRGRKLVYRVYAPSNNTCWGYLTLEDKLGPVIMCEDDTVNCWEAEELLDPTIADNCGYMAVYEQTSLQWFDYNCENDTFVGYVQRDVVTQDIWGNTNRCIGQRLYILRESLDSLVCPEELVEIECCTKKELEGVMVDVLWNSKYAYEDEDGYAHPIPFEGGLVEPPYLLDRGGRHYMIPNQNNRGKCNIITEYKDKIIPTCGASYKIRREWKLFDWCTAEDTICIQWIKITDTLAPEIESNGNVKRVCLDDPSGLWESTDDNFDCDELVEAHDLTPYEDDCIRPRKFTVQPHDCKGHVELERPKIINECGIKFAKGDEEKIADQMSKIIVTYELQYIDPVHPVKVITVTGDIPHGEKEIIYLPAGWYQILYLIKDECWNETYACEWIWVEDNVAPTPVCDEITQVTLDPESCWTRIPAETLDDGSNDNCSQNLHFAVANMDTIEYYRDYWTAKFLDCIDPYLYEAHHYYFEDLIEHWINCFVFNEYIDVSECGEEMLVLRVYEADGLPLLDEHTFVGNKHQWFCFNLYDDYACFFKYHYDDFANHKNPRIDLCEYDYIFPDYDPCYNGTQASIKGAHPYVVDPYCGCTDIPNCPCENGERMVTAPALSNPTGLLNVGGLGDFDNVHGPQPNRACCLFQTAAAPDSSRFKWEALVLQYPELGVIDCKRYSFKHLYNDCMIQVLKDDKTPPVCIAPADVTAYCDGVPYEGTIRIGNDEISWLGASFAHDICDGRDVFDPNCYLDDDTDTGTKQTAPQEWCVAVPWDGGEYGYYGGPSESEYIYPGLEPCGETLPWYDENNWKPIYCRIWLLLDQFDSLSSGKPNPEDFFGEPTIEENCWTYTDSTITDGALDECGTGSIVRTWYITDKCGNTSSCAQRVTFKPRSDFEVKFPEDLEVSCDEEFRLEPIRGTELYPIITDDECELIGVTYNDQVLDTDADGCFKILRTWKVIDWCLYNPDIQIRYPDVIVDNRYIAGEDRPCVVRHLKDDGDGFITYLQVIKVIDQEAPVLTCITADTICSYDDDCGVVFVDIELGTAEDNCTPEDQIDYRYVIIPDYATDEFDYIFGHGNSIKQPLPVGRHSVYLIAEDNCNNADSCHIDLYLKDCKPPTPYCFDGIATVLMQDSGQVEVWAIDLDAGSFDNCTEKDSLIFSFDLEGTMQARTFTCDDLGDIEVEMYVTDEDGNTDFCVVTLSIQEGSSRVCGGTSVSNHTPGGINAPKKNPTSKSGDKGVIFVKDPINEGAISTGNITLHQNRPNPYQYETKISFETLTSQQLTLQVYDVTGKLIWSQQGNYAAGYHEVILNKMELPISSGVLYYQLASQNELATKKMIMIE